MSSEEDGHPRPDVWISPQSLGPKFKVVCFTMHCGRTSSRYPKRTNPQDFTDSGLWTELTFPF